MKQETLLRAGGIDTTFEMAYDYDLALRMSEGAHPYLIIEYLYNYCCHADSISSKNKRAQSAWSHIAQEKAKPISDVVFDESIKAQPFLVWLDRPLEIGGVASLIGNPHELYISCGRLGSGSILMRVIGQYLVYC